MSGGHYLNVVLSGLLFDQFEQEPLPCRVNAGIDLLEEIQALGVFAEQYSQHGEKTQRAVRRAISRYLSAVCLA